jgi:hypothetical protein
MAFLVSGPARVPRVVIDPSSGTSRHKGHLPSSFVAELKNQSRELADESTDINTAVDGCLALGPEGPRV